MSNIVEYSSVLSELICEDIIENIDPLKSTIPIPKNDPEWDRIERILYKIILTLLTQYKLHIMESNPVLAKELGKKLKLEEFTIQKAVGPRFLRPVSRKHVVTFVLFLTQPQGGELKFAQHTIIPEIGKLVFFPDDLDHMYTMAPHTGEYWVISNQISCI